MRSSAAQPQTQNAENCRTVQAMSSVDVDVWSLASYAGTALLAVIAFFVLDLVFRLAVNMWQGQALEKMPAVPTANWLIGNMKQVMDEPPLAPQTKWSKEHGRIFRYKMMLQETRVYVGDLDAVQYILQGKNASYYHKPAVTVDQLEPLVGRNSLLVVEEKEHTRQRRIMNPAFHQVHVDALTGVFAHHASKLCAKMEKLEGSEVDMHRLFSEVALDIIGSAGFGKEMGALDESEDASFYDAFSALLPRLSVKLVLSMAYPTLAKLFVSKAERENRALVEEQTRAIVQKRQAEWEQMVEDGTLDDMPRDVLTLLFQGAGEEKLTEEELMNNLLVLITAGHETTANLMTWMTYLLTQHPDVMEAVRDEVRDIVGTGRDPTPKDLEQCTLLRNVINETLRLYPPVALTQRVMTVEDTIGGYDVPSGTMVFISPYVMHRDPELWGEDADEFKPDRWLKEEPAPAYAFMPFLHGKRKCIGWRFAVQEAMVVMAMVLRDFRLDLVPGQKVEASLAVTLRVKNGLKVFAKPWEE